MKVAPLARTKRILDSSAFPVRIKVRSPYVTTGGEPSLILVWMLNKLGRGNYAHHASPTASGAEVVFYFRRVEHALALLKAFPELELADSVGEHRLTVTKPRKPLAD
jgi:hypothetical protein